MTSLGAKASGLASLLVARCWCSLIMHALLCCDEQLDTDTKWVLSVADFDPQDRRDADADGQNSQHSNVDSSLTDRLTDQRL